MLYSNLHRADLSKDERDRQIRRYAELIGQSLQNAAFESVREDGRGHRREGVASIIAKETGVSKDTVERTLNPERVAAERARSKIDKDVKELTAWHGTKLSWTAPQDSWSAHAQQNLDSAPLRGRSHTGRTYLRKPISS